MLGFGAEASFMIGGGYLPDPIPTQAEEDAARSAPLVMYLREHHAKALKSGTDDELAKALRTAMIAMSYMGASPQALPTPIKSVTDMAIIERYEKFVPYPADTSKLPSFMVLPVTQHKIKLYDKLMAVAKDVAAMPPIGQPSLAQRIGAQLTAGMPKAAAPPPQTYAQTYVPPEPGFPWLWVGLGALALGGVGYVVYKKTRKG